MCNNHRFLLDGLHEDLNKICGNPPYQELKDIAGEAESDTAARWWAVHRGRNDSAIMDIFCGQLKSCVSCLKCGHTSKVFDPFMDLSLNVPAPGSSIGGAASISLVDCLNRFIKEETLTGSERFYCSHCKKHQDSTKKLEVWRLPLVLVLHFKRFAYSAVLRRKLSQDIQFPLRECLDMTPYCTTNPRLTNGTPCSGQYQLFGVINHMGSMEGGHYTSFCQSPKDGQWYEFDDARVTKVNPSTVGGPSSYILFYHLI